MLEKLRIAVCEASPDDREQIQAYLLQSSDRLSLSFYSGGENFLAHYRYGAFDLILINTELAGLSGLETIKRLRTFDADVPVIFISSSTDSAADSYRLHAVRYYVKPIRQTDIADALRVASIYRQSLPHLHWRNQNTDNGGLIYEILYLEQHLHQIYIHTTQQNLTIYGKLSDLISQLPGTSFISPHKSFIINLAYIEDVDRELKCFVMSGGINVPISRRRFSASIKALEAYRQNSTWNDTLIHDEMTPSDEQGNPGSVQTGGL